MSQENNPMNNPFPSSQSANSTLDAGMAADTADSGSNHAPRTVELMDRVVRGAHDTIDRLAERATPRVQQLEETITVANSRVQEKAEHIREVGDEWAESLRCSVRANPMASIGLAVGAGWLLARLTR